MSIGAGEFFFFILEGEIDFSVQKIALYMTCSKWSKSGRYDILSLICTKYAKELSIGANEEFFVLEDENHLFRTKNYSKHDLLKNEVNLVLSVLNVLKKYQSKQMNFLRFGVQNSRFLYRKLHLTLLAPNEVNLVYIDVLSLNYTKCAKEISIGADENFCVLEGEIHVFCTENCTKHDLPQISKSGIYRRLKSYLY
jgi:hypothetical protein